MNKDKAPFRKLKVSFWDDEQISEDLTPEDRYFYLYLMTNPFTSQLGIYTITRKQIANHLGYGVDIAENLIKRFEDYHKLIKYNRDTKEIALRKWSKHNWNSGGIPVWDLIKKEIDSVKDRSLLELLIAESADTWLSKEIKKYLGFPENGENGDDSYHDTYHKKEELRTKKEELINKNIPSPKVDYHSEFEIFWNAYKKKTDKKNAFTKFKLKRKKFSFEKIMDGVHAYMAQEERRGTETRFIKGPCVFLNGENFNDEYEVVGGTRNNAQNDDAEQFIKDNDVPF